MRCFLAVEIPPAVRQALAGLQEELSRIESGWRWIAADSLHVTLRFLGQVGDEDVRRASDLWAGAARAVPAFRLLATRVGVFPEARRPRVAWVGVEEPERQGRWPGLAAALEAATRAAGLGAEERPFHGHVTIARAAVGARPRGAIAGHVGPACEIPVREVVLYESRLASDRARYTSVSRFPLGEAQGGPSHA